jgi:5-methylcytosine-specific restriction endonuclease McrA
MSNSLRLPTLVLNSAWQPISVASVRKSLQKVFAGAASLMDHESFALYDFENWCELPVKNGHRIITLTNGGEIRAPEIIVLRNYDRFPEREVKLTRRNLLIRDNFTCQYTGKKLTARDATIDHVMPQSRGGKTTWENVVICCPLANTRKADKTPGEAGMHLLKQPRQPRWSPVYTRYARYTSTKSCPESWRKFVDWDPDTYWDIELDED